MPDSALYERVARLEKAVEALRDEMTHYRLQKGVAPNLALPFTGNYLFDSLGLYTPVSNDPRYLSLSVVGSPTGSSATFQFGFDQNRPGRLVYRPANEPTNYSYTTAQEDNSYGGVGNEHEQTIGGLQSSTDYEVASQTSSDGGVTWETVSPWVSFTTAAAVGLVADDSLRLSGIFFGSPFHGISMLHQQLTRERCQITAVKTVIEEPGTITEVAKHRRVGEGGYSRGNGGNYFVKVVGAFSDGSINVNDVICTSDPAANYVYNSGAVNSSNLLWVTLSEQTRDVARHEIVYFIWDSRSDSNYSVFNGTHNAQYVQTVPGIGGRGPYLGEHNNVLYIASNINGPFTPDSYVNLRPFMPYMINGRARGNYSSYVSGGHINTSAAGAGDSPARLIKGSTIARQTWTMVDSSITVDGMWMNYGHNPSGTDTPADLTCELRDGSDVLLRSYTLPYNSTLAALNKSGGAFHEQLAKTWGFAPFSDVDFDLGQTYYVEMSTTAASGFVVHAGIGSWPNETSDRGMPGAEQVQAWESANATINLGAGYGNWSNAYASRDLPILFTIKGQPKQVLI